jgi:type II secretory pathway pseudopilin PulG
MTLVEIIITLLISSIIAASTFMFFAGQQRIYETQTKLLNVQQNLWAAMEVVARHTRASGSGMYQCVRPASYANGAANGAGRLLSAAPSDGPVTSGGAVISSMESRPHTGLRAYDAAGGMQWIPPLWIVDNSTADTIDTVTVAPGTDILTVAFGNRTSGTDTDATLQLGVVSFAPTSLLTLVGADTAKMFRQWEFILLLTTPDWGFGVDPTTDRGCTLLRVTNDTTAGGNTLTHASVSKETNGIVWNPNAHIDEMGPNPGYVANASGVRNFGDLTWVTFFITKVVKTRAGHTLNEVPYLMMQQRNQSGDAGKPQILAEGIEDLQISFACDSGSLGIADFAGVNGELDEGTTDGSKTTDEWWNNVPDDQLPQSGQEGFCNLPTAVRLTLVARTLSEDDLIDKLTTSNGPMDVENHRYGTRPADGFRRRVMSTTIYPRNNKPL